MHIERTLKKVIIEANNVFKVLLITGPRQVGKTTILKNIQANTRSYISLDDIDIRMAAKEDPAGFIDSLKLPVIIDEVQYAPELFPYIKVLVDSSNEKGSVWLTGSQQFSMMKNISESLAGRMAIIELQGISQAEEEKRPNTPEFIPTKDIIRQRREIAQEISKEKIFHRIWRGSYPEMVINNANQWKLFYDGYLTTYIERDVREYLKIDDLMKFKKFMKVSANRTGQLLNFREISKEVKVTEPTIKSWFNVLEATGIIKLIYPYYKNTTKRILKTPKFHFMDTGLCCYLGHWLNPEVLEHGAMSGAFLESFVVSEIYKSHIHNSTIPSIYYYADKDKKEVDLLIEQNGLLHPIEIKKTSSVRNSGFKGFDYLKNLSTPIGHGAIICFQKSVIPFNNEIDIVPIGLI